jgi:mannose-6-phosphate isomerase-like protein (cupin superfamily)
MPATEVGGRAVEVVNLEDKFGRFAEHWSPKIIAQLNDYHVRAVKLLGEFVWHKHDETDELFLVTKGNLLIRFRDRDMTLGPGELLVIPKGVEHMPVAEAECEVLLFEPAATVNTGSTGGERTVEPDWI